MKRFIAGIMTCVIALTLSGCELDEFNRLPNIVQLPEPISEDRDNSEFSDEPPVSEEQTAPEEPIIPEEPTVPKEPQNPEFTYLVDNIHDPISDEELYNINDTYEPTARYYRTFEWLNSSAALWYGEAEGLNAVYDREKALEFAEAHWNDGLDYCAPFVSRCFEAGGLPISSESSTALLCLLIHSGLGYGEFLPMNADGTVTLPDYAEPGDFVGIYCHSEGLMVHSVLYAGNDENGNMRAYAHNPPDGAEDTFHYLDVCKYCGGELTEVFFFNFGGEGEANVLLSENAGYVISEWRYDREKAISSVSEPVDGFAERGAVQTSAALMAGGLDIDAHIQASIFMMLLKSRLGAVYSLPVNDDRTVTLPDITEPGDVCFLYCSDEALIYSSFIVKGADGDGKMLGYTRDRLNDENSAFRVESVCPSSICGGEITEVLLFHFE